MADGEAFTAQAVEESCVLVNTRDIASYWGVEDVEQIMAAEQMMAAEAYMQRFQESPSAWEVCEQLLNSEHVATMLFAVQTLRAKVADSFDELPAEAVLPFRDAMLVHRTKHREDGRAVVTQLCVSVADIAVQCEAWDDPVGDLFRAFSQSEGMVPCLVELLIKLPEESRNPRLRVPSSRRPLFASAISTYFEHVRAAPRPCLRRRMHTPSPRC